MITIKLKNYSGRWEAVDCPVSRDRLEHYRGRWQDFVRSHPTPDGQIGHEGSGTSASAAMTATGADLLPLNGFDKLILAQAIVAKQVRYL